MQKMQMQVEGLDALMERMQKLGVDTRSAVNKALIETHKIVTEKAEAAIKPHRRTGATEASLRREAVPEWSGDAASIKVGFDIENGGLPSIFLMYETKIHGTPRTKPADPALYNAFFGKETIKEIVEAQEKAIYTAIHSAEGANG